MMVADVKLNRNGYVGPNDVKIIESTHYNGWDVFGVTKRNTLQEYTNGDAPKNWVIGRLK